MIKRKQAVLLLLIGGLAAVLYSYFSSKRDASLQTVLQSSTPYQIDTDIFNPQRDDKAAFAISEAFRQTFPKNSAYWSRRHHALLEKLDITNISDWMRNKFNKPLCNPPAGDLMRANIADFDSYPEMFKNFVPKIECRDSRILIDQPNKCRNMNGEGRPFLLLAVKSEPGNFLQRQAIRDTWGQQGTYGGLTVRTMFLLGTVMKQEPSLQHLLEFEGKYFGDLVQWDLQDTFYSRTLKDAVFLEWILTHCSHVTYIFRGYDNVFINVAALLRYLQSLNPEKASKLYAGHINVNANPVHDPQEKYYVPPSFYEGPYPPYASGDGFLLSGSLVRPLTRVSLFVPLFIFDDVYMGMCLQALGVELEEHVGFQVNMQVSDDNGCSYKDFLVVFNRNPQQILKMWKNINSPLLVC